MGLFFKIEDKGKYYLISRRKSAMSYLYFFLFYYFILGPVILLIFSLSGASFSATVVVLLTLSIFAIYGAGGLFGFEGAYYGSILPKRYEKQGKKIVRSIGTIKIYK